MSFRVEQPEEAVRLSTHRTCHPESLSNSGWYLVDLEHLLNFDPEMRVLLPPVCDLIFFTYNIPGHGHREQLSYGGATSEPLLFASS